MLVGVRGLSCGAIGNMDDIDRQIVLDILREQGVAPLTARGPVIGFVTTYVELHSNERAHVHITTGFRLVLETPNGDASPPPVYNP